jgi:hypothetical protein
MADLLNGDPAALPLCEPSEHGVEIWGAGGKHHLRHTKP